MKMYKLAFLVLLVIIALLFVMKRGKKNRMGDKPEMTGDSEALPPVSDPVTEAVEAVDE